ncbi:MAG: cytochrome C biogenesis protein [Nitrospirae bacterium CG_4_10_14_0_8_um_filter_41_23]|nr:MAG: cytochrome C biogenesis protein [Nitrospirae bacterium CG_4_10_14_0_8_um_filter_41_23]
MKDVSFPFAFLAGILSFLSPCILPLVPSYISFITGISFGDLTTGTAGMDRKRIRYLTITNSFAFIFGFSTVFIALGLSSSAIGSFLFEYLDLLRIIGGILVIIFGLFITGFLKLSFLMKDKKIHLSGKPAGYIGTFIVGMTFAAGWSPCIGPILATILVYAGAKGSVVYGLKLLTVYSLGLAMPFFVSALAINSFLSYSKKLVRYMRMIMIISGLLLIVFGIMLLTDQVKYLTGLLPVVFPLIL